MVTVLSSDEEDTAEDGYSSDGSEQQEQISRTHQAYGRNYQLPNLTAHNETCAAIGNVLWNWRMFLATGEAKYVDVIELSLYNAILAGISLDGVDFFYVNPLRNIEPLPTALRWARTRVPFVTSFCPMTIRSPHTASTKHPAPHRVQTAPRFPTEYPDASRTPHADQSATPG